MGAVAAVAALAVVAGETPETEGGTTGKEDDEVVAEDNVVAVEVDMDRVEGEDDGDDDETTEDTGATDTGGAPEGMWIVLRLPSTAEVPCLLSVVSLAGARGMLAVAIVLLATLRDAAGFGLPTGASRKAAFSVLFVGFAIGLEAGSGFTAPKDEDVLSGWASSAET